MNSPFFFSFGGDFRTAESLSSYKIWHYAKKALSNNKHKYEIIEIVHPKPGLLHFIHTNLLFYKITNVQV